MASFVEDFSAPGARTISDFNPREDTLDLQGLGENPNFSEISVSSSEGGTLIDYGGASTVLVEGVTPDELRPSNVTIDGGALKVGPSGRDLDSVVRDLAEGNDLLSGGLGNDTFDGGAGDDIIRGQMGHDYLKGGEGDDQLFGMRNKDTLEGGAGDDLLDGGRGIDRLDGGTGDDTLIGGGANDFLTGGEGSDTFVQNFAVSGNDIITDFNPSEDTIELQGFTNINLEEFSITEVDGDTLIDGGTGNSLRIEGVTPDQLGTTNITLDGEALTLGPGDSLESVLNNLATDAQQDGVNLKGFQGDQTFAGGAGDDNLFGQDGEDTLQGRGGDDILGGGRGDDILEGGAGDDVLSGGRDDDTLSGGKGDDTLVGGKGDDTLTGGRGSDTFVQNFSEQGADTITDFNPSQDTIELQGFGGIENISRISLTEADGGTVIGVGSGNTLFVAGVSPDQLGAGNITIEGDALTAGSSGSDLGSIISDLAALNDETPVDEAAVDLNLQGGKRDDTLEGGAGDDVLKGGGGDDTLQGGAGDDVLRGGRGDDTLEGGRGADILKGGAGDDIISGGAGDDILTGQKGADTFVQDFSQPGADTITDFRPGQDTIDFTGLDNLDNISVEEADGGTLINAGPGNSLFVKGVALDQFSVDNITIDGQAVSSGSDGLDLGSVLGDAASGSNGLDASLGQSLDASASQGGAVAESQAKDGGQEQAGAVSEVAAAEEAAAEEAAVEEETAAGA
jgi:Ca2+-binding RTX toxin-like protein